MDRIDAMKVFVATLDGGCLADVSHRLGKSSVGDRPPTHSTP